MKWKIYNLRGPRADVRAKVDANDQLPAAAKAYLLAQIDALPANCFALTINGYCELHTVGTNQVFNNQITITGQTS